MFIVPSGMNYGIVATMCRPIPAVSDPRGSGSAAMMSNVSSARPRKALVLSCRRTVRELGRQEPGHVHNVSTRPMFLQYRTPRVADKAGASEPEPGQCPQQFYPGVP